MTIQQNNQKRVHKKSDYGKGQSDIHQPYDKSAGQLILTLVFKALEG